jgi:hypothetical protein
MVLILPYKRYGLASFVLGWLGAVVTMMQLIAVPNWAFFVFILLAIAGVVLWLVGFNRYAQCPACGKFPRNNDNRVALKADSCSHCGEKLMCNV